MIFSALYTLAIFAFRNRGIYGGVHAVFVLPFSMRWIRGGTFWLPFSRPYRSRLMSPGCDLWNHVGILLSALLGLCCLPFVAFLFLRLPGVLPDFTHVLTT
ncbi:hypothetical protein GE09DRAFT_124599 [Coniochaeta sp. 2T2.1]|nr:hypothetical protein GE09DRAFT_124599 [Coniochaeta sp. 2T2.1]